MISRLHIRNFKCFENHTISFNDKTTIIVGRNNAGKSTIVEALRLISIVASRYQSLNYQDVPNWLDIPKQMRGVSPNIADIEFNQEETFHQYSAPPAIIEAFFNNNTSISIFLGLQENIHAVIKDSKGNPIKTRTEANKCFIPKISIMPQVAPVSKNETPLTPEYVKRAVSSPLAPIHFRNQLDVYRDSFSTFKRIAEETWSGLRIRDLISYRNQPEQPSNYLFKMRALLPI